MKGDKRITIYDVAREAHTSVATVSKALNGKSDIGESTRQMILDTAKKLGYSASKTASSISRKPIHIVVLLPQKMNSYMAEALRGIEFAMAELQDFKISAKIHLVPENRSVVFLEALKDYVSQGYDGAILFPPIDMTHAADLLKAANIPANFPIATVTTDIDPDARLFCSQCDAFSSGRMAAELLSLPISKGGTVAFVTGSMEAQVQQLNRDGFLSEIQKRDLICVDTYEHMNIPEKAREMAKKLIAEHPDLNGLYISTAISTSFIEQLRDLDVLSNIWIVASDISPQMLNYIRKGEVMATIFQNPYKQGRLSLQYMYEYLAKQGDVSFEKTNIFPQPVLSSNTDYYEHLYLERLENRFSSDTP